MDKNAPLVPYTYCIGKLKFMDIEGTCGGADGGGRQTERSCDNLVGTPICTAANVPRTDVLPPLTNRHCD